MNKENESSTLFDSVLILAFGGPRGRGDVQPFLNNVAVGRGIPPERLSKVADIYALYNGFSPLADITLRQAVCLHERLQQQQIPWPVFVGMRHWHPYLQDTLEEMALAGHRRIVTLIMSAFHSPPGCFDYKKQVAQAVEAIREKHKIALQVIYVDSWFDHDAFIAANVNRLRPAFEKLPADRRDRARLIFSAHSIPESMARRCRYVEQYSQAARRVAQGVGCRDYALVYQSRSGRPSDPWLAPDLCDYISAEAGRGLTAAVISPLGFVADHIEVLYELDRRALPLCAELDITAVRAEALNDEPSFIDMMTDLVTRVYTRSQQGLPLPVSLGTLSA